MFWHGGLPLLVIAYALGKNDPRRVIGPNRRGRFLIVGLQQVTETQFRLVTAYWNNDGRAQRIYEDGQ